MGRKQSDPIRLYFTFNIETKEQMCNINNCNVKISNNMISNLRRHIKSKHNDIYTEYQLKLIEAAKSNKIEKETIKIKINRQELKQACVGMIANGCTYKLFNSRDFRQIIGPISSSLNITINAETVKNEILLEALKVKTSITDDLGNGMFSIKIDEATRLNRSILGINVQYIKDNQIIIKTIAMLELTERHTSENLKQIILHTLTSYRLKINQIYSITCDNGRNMVKAARLINETLDDSPEMKAEEFYDGLDKIKNINDAVQSIIQQYGSKSEFLVNTIKCAAHTVQLAVNDFLKEQKSVRDKISKLRDLSIYLRTPTHRNILIQQQLRQPIINNVTRWNSTFNMIERLLDFKDYCQMYQHIYSELNIDDLLWSFASEFITVFSPIKHITLKLQGEQLCMGEFFKCWLELKICVEQIHLPMAEILLQKIKGRENQLIENSVVAAAMFLDPRFHCTLSNANKEASIAHLKHLYEHQYNLLEPQQEVSSNNSSNATPSPCSSTSNSSNQDINILMNAYIANHNQNVTNTNTNSKIDEAFKQIQNYCPRPLDININVLDYWMVKKNELPYLSSLAKIVHAVPATQSSVERCFSSLKLLLSDQRNKLSADSINNILLVKCNSKFEYQNEF